ncbi:MAG: type II secretion system protein GspG [Gammaproteobacteria bacterium]|nr:type II secretion system protein GspG [Gammaproteobacteria bacterium]
MEQKMRTGSTGFSLIELLVVLVIMGMLAGLVGPRLFNKVDSSKVKTAQTQVKMLKAALQSFRLDVGRYPSSEEGLKVLVYKLDSIKSWDGPYLEDELPQDPWNTPYVYDFGSDNLQGFALYSYGADNKEGGEGLDADVGYLP